MRTALTEPAGACLRIADTLGVLEPGSGLPSDPNPTDDACTCSDRLASVELPIARGGLGLFRYAV